ncbi:hypothetical protein RND71_026639 [Anisodus tanguticus]|uniref:3'-5' exonuclease domain-containing protein n=1 Tax=Anisodus tanguticus TaxID=243964 RepID=A0AAE1VBH0_9SOLA|nr:hypothetical protein RND71_026639 [Anisodus tanguticus]
MELAIDHLVEDDRYDLYDVYFSIGIESDVEKLEKDYKLFVENIIDLRQLTADVYNSKSLRDAGLKRLCKSLLVIEVEKPKHVAIGRWDKKRLDMDQVHYACVDAFVSFLIGKHLTASGYYSSSSLLQIWID